MIKNSYILGLMLIVVSISFKMVRGEDSLLTVLQEELNREYAELQNEELPPYYIEYRVSDMIIYTAKSSFGSLTEANKDHKRLVNVVVKVGDYSFDNTHIYPDEETASDYNYNFTSLLPLDNDGIAIKQILWWFTNKAYINALSVYKSIKEQDKTKKSNDKKKPQDFSKEKAIQYYEEPVDFKNFNFTNLKSTLKECSSVFLGDTALLSGEASFQFVIERKYFVSSEGSAIVQNISYTQLQTFATIRNSKGNLDYLIKSYVARTPENLPAKSDLLPDIEQMKSDLNRFINCPVAEPYTGPAILSSSAAGVFFHEIFGHRIEGHRLKDETDAHTFKEKVGTKVLPKTFDVYFDPEQEVFNNKDLIGHYWYDDEGVKATKVKVVEQGLLKTFLMSRTPVEGFSNSNGHGRAQTGYEPVARQSNMFVKSSSPISNEALRKKLIKACKSQKLEYGYYFKSVYGGFTYTTRYTPNVFNIFPLEVYRIFVDGRPDELVRGVELIGTPLAMFAEIKAAGDQYEVFNGFCGAESGMIPVSTIAPAIFVNKIETQNQPNSYMNAPILKMPGYDKNLTDKKNKP